jgi:hypothetical protein
MTASANVIFFVIYGLLIFSDNTDLLPPVLEVTEKACCNFTKSPLFPQILALAASPPTEKFDLAPVSGNVVLFPNASDSPLPSPVQ